METPYEEVMGLRFHCLTLPQALTAVDHLIEQRIPSQIVLANAYTFALCRQDPSLHTLMTNAALTLADGMSIVWGGHWLGIKLPGRVAGPDLMEELCAHAEKTGSKIFLMGSSFDNLVRLKEVLISRWPQLRIVGLHSPSVSDRFDEEETQRILTEIEQAHPEILFVGVSAPKQEIWIAENLHRMAVPVAIGVGAAFDFLSGRIPRAPMVLRNIGLEWLYRLWREPRRLWKRYLLGNAVFLSMLFKEAVKRRWTRARSSSRFSF